MKILLNHNGNRGYGSDQVTGITLGDLLEQVQVAVDQYGDDMEVVLYQTNNHGGASYGTFARPWGDSIFTESDDDE